jgi:hypothetical protein
MKNGKTYTIDDIRVKIFGNSRLGYFATFIYMGECPEKENFVILHKANGNRSFKTIKEIKEIADRMSTANY